LAEKYKLAFSSMVQTEKEQFAEQSYFAAQGQDVGEEEADESDSPVSSLNSEGEDEEGRERRSQRGPFLEEGWKALRLGYLTSHNLLVSR
jgi:hypothetical protein